MDVIDPVSMSVIKTMTFSQNLGGVTADSQGDIFVAAQNQLIEFSPTGAMLKTLVTTVGDPCNLQISDSGQLVAGSRSQQVLMSDTSLQSFTKFSVPGDFESMFAAFTSPTLVPEPTGFVGAMGVIVLLSSYRPKREMKRGRDCYRGITPAIAEALRQPVQPGA